MGLNLKPVGAGAVFKSAFPERFKPKDGEAYRMWWPEVENIYRAQTHYLKPNYVFCLQAPENGIGKSCPVCSQGEYPRFRYGMNVVLFKTDASGKLRPTVKQIGGKDVDSVDWEIKLWLFSQTVANEIYSISQIYETDPEWPFKHDVLVRATDVMRGKYSVQAYPDAVFTTKTELQDLILNDLKLGRRDPVKELAILQTEQEMVAAIASGALKRDEKEKKKDNGGGELQTRKPFPASEVREAAHSSASVISPKEGHSPADKAMADEMVSGNKSSEREISNDKDFQELLAKVKAVKAAPKQ